jgi:transposase InsO family protein
VTKYRHYLEGCKEFSLYTDHSSLRHFFTQPNLSSRQLRWAEKLAPYHGNMRIIYRKGTDNVADALSRLYTPAEVRAEEPPLPPLPLFVTVTELTLDSDLFDQIKTGYATDSYFSSPELPSFVKQRDDGFYYVNERIAVPNISQLRQRLLFEFHDAPYAAHPGYLKTLNAIASRFWWPRLSRNVRAYTNSCATCQRIKPTSRAKAGLLHPLPVPERPWTHISLDLITDLPASTTFAGQSADSILTIVDLFTKQAHFVPTNKTVTAVQLAQLIIEHVYRLHGLPTVMISDRDPRFTSDFWQALLRHLGTKLNMSTAYHPETDGQTERTNRTIEQLLRAMIQPRHDNWASSLPIAEFAYNSSVHSSSKVSPFYANYGFDPATPALLHGPLPVPGPASSFLARLRDVHAAVRNELELTKLQQAEYANRSRRDLTFSVGDKVRLDTSHLVFPDQPSKKFKDRFIGPYSIAEVISRTAYKLNLPASFKRVHPVFHVSRLLPWHDNDDDLFPGRTQPARPVTRASDYVNVDDKKTFDVDCITDVRLDSYKYRGKPLQRLQFHVRWLGFDASEDTWEPLANVVKLDALRSFMASPAWLSFKDTDDFRAFAEKFPALLPPDP